MLLHLNLISYLYYSHSSHHPSKRVKRANDGCFQRASGGYTMEPALHYADTTSLTCQGTRFSSTHPFGTTHSFRHKVFTTFLGSSATGTPCSLSTLSTAQSLPLFWSLHCQL